MKLLNILTVMLLLTRTFAAAAGAVSSDPMEADRKWLKQQEDFSEQLRRHPDKALQQELEAQISRNPLARSDQQFIDNLASQQRESTRDKPTEGAVYFISFSIPDEGLKRMLHETHRYGIPATLRGLVNNDMKATTDAVMGLVDTMLSIKIDKLRAYLQNTPAANLVEEKIEKTAISIRAVLTNYVKAIRYLQGIEKNGEPFTIRDWMRGVREDRPNGWLFISSNADTHASLKPVISMWLSIAIRGLLAMGENRNRRVWIFADELPTLHKLPDLVEILPEARKFGGCYVFGIQSYAQLEDIYGVKPAATLFDVMNTRAFFRSPSKEIAEFAAGEIGEKEILKASEQYSYGADPVRDGVSTGKEKERETLVSYSDIQTLPDLSCYVTLPTSCSPFRRGSRSG